MSSNKIDHIHWLGHASFLIEDADARIYIDPWKLPPNSPPANLILITHSHYDHCSPDDVKLICRPETILVATQDSLSKCGGKGVTVKPGMNITAGRWNIETTPAYNMGKKFHPKENGWVGYIVTISTGQRIFHSGDTDAIPEITRVKTDIALLPCGGTYTMTGREAGGVARTMKPSVVVPMHWGDIVGGMKDADEVKQIFPETVILAPERNRANPGPP